MVRNVFLIRQNVLLLYNNVLFRRSGCFKWDKWPYCCQLHHSLCIISLQVDFSWTCFQPEAISFRWAGEGGRYTNKTLLPSLIICSSHWDTKRPQSQATILIPGEDGRNKQFFCQTWWLIPALMTDRAVSFFTTLEFWHRKTTSGLLTDRNKNTK